MAIAGFAAAAETMTVPNGYCVDLIKDQRCIKDRTTLNVSVIDEGKAADLFRSFKADPSYAWNYSQDGCYARAHKMAHAADQQGISFAKIVVEGKLKVGPVGPTQPYPFRWQWHVAPVVYVKSVKDGKESVELMVIDPSIFQRPVPVAEWKEQLMQNEFERPLAAAQSFRKATAGEDKLGYRPKPSVEMPRFFRPEIMESYFGSKYSYLRRHDSPEDVVEWNAASLQAADKTLATYRLYEAHVQLPGSMDYTPTSPVLMLRGGAAR